jgi:HEAT repeat protein
MSLHLPRLIALVSLVMLSTPLLAQERAPAKPAGPTAEEAKAAAAEVKAALRGADPAERVAAIERAATVDHVEVVKEMAGGLRDKDEAVRLATIRAFGRMQDGEALLELHRLAKTSLKKLEKDSKVHAAVYRAIGQHGDKSSVDILATDVQGNLDADVVRARIYALGNIRTKESVEELFKGMNLGNPLPGEDSPFMPDVRVALARLTGTDQTTNKSMWQEWWNKNRKEFKVSPTPPELPRELQQRWDDYWGSDLARSAPAATGSERAPGAPKEPGTEGEKPRGG